MVVYNINKQDHTFEVQFNVKASAIRWTSYLDLEFVVVIQDVNDNDPDFKHQVTAYDISNDKPEKMWSRLTLEEPDMLTEVESVITEALRTY